MYGLHGYGLYGLHTAMHSLLSWDVHFAFCTVNDFSKLNKIAHADLINPSRIIYHVFSLNVNKH